MTMKPDRLSARCLAHWLAILVVFASGSCSTEELTRITQSSDHRSSRQSESAPALLTGPDKSPTRSVSSDTSLAPDPSTPGQPGQPAAISLDSFGLAVSEPAYGEWEAETVNDRASLELKRLAGLLRSPERAGGDRVSQLVHPSFRCTHLRPKSLRTIFEDAAFLARRAAEGPTETEHADFAFQGAEGFASAIDALVEPLRGGETLLADFKVFRVRIVEEAVATSAHFQMAARTEEGVAQQTAVWDCVWHDDGGTLRLTEVRVTDYQETIGRGKTGSLFSDCTESVFGEAAGYRDQLVYGVDHWTGRIDRTLGVDAAGWEGLALADVNGDGLEDLYVCQPGGLPNRLFLQRDDGTLIESSRRGGVDWLDETQSALFVDLDNDGHQDLVVSTASGLILMQGDGQGRFEVMATKLLPEAAAFSLSAADFDSDGDLDLYACCYAVRRQRLPGTTFGRPMPYHDANNGGRNVLYRNDRHWRFRDVTEAVGLGQNNRRFSFAAAWEDYDNDGDLDLYVANDYGRNNLYRFDRERMSFEDVAAEAGVEDISAGMSVSWGDYDHDGWMDLYVSNMWSSAGNRIAYQRRFQAEADETARAQFQRHARGNSLFRNTGQGTFHDVSVHAGVTMGRWAWGSLFADVNNDGLDDLLVANGFITQNDPGDL